MWSFPELLLEFPRPSEASIIGAYEMSANLKYRSPALIGTLQSLIGFDDFLIGWKIFDFTHVAVVTVLSVQMKNAHFTVSHS